MEFNNENNLSNGVGQAGGFATCHNLNRVTTVSKYLALALFVALPFLGGYVGYVYAPEKVVEIDRIMEIKNESSSNVESQTDPNQVIETNLEQYSMLPEYSVLPISDFLNVDEMLDMAPFSWNKNDAYREYALYDYVGDLEVGRELELKHDCYSVDCQKVTLINDVYSRRFLTNEDDYNLYEKFEISTLGDYLEDNGFTFIYEIAKGWQFGEVYQKTVDDSILIVGVYSKPINLTFPEDGSYPSSKGEEIRVYIGTPFILVHEEQNISIDQNFRVVAQDENIFLHQKRYFSYYPQYSHDNKYILSTQKLVEEGFLPTELENSYSLNVTKINSNKYVIVDIKSEGKLLHTILYDEVENEIIGELNIEDIWPNVSGQNIWLATFNKNLTPSDYSYLVSVEDAFGRYGNPKIVIYDLYKGTNEILYEEKRADYALAESCEMGCVGLLHINTDQDLQVGVYKKQDNLSTDYIDTLIVKIPDIYKNNI